jgi:hypothetical protein
MDQGAAMRDLTSVLQELYRRDVNCRIQSVWDCGFRIVLGDESNGDLASFDIRAEELPLAGERLWDLACRHLPVLAQPEVPASRLIARAVPENVFPVDLLPVDLMEDPVVEPEVLAYTVAAANEECETVWYLNSRGEVRQEALGLREGWRQTDRFRYGEEKPLAEFRHLYLEKVRG